MSKLLHQLNLPEDLKKLKLNELETLCRELRNEILQQVSAYGGHLASNMGVVELSVAMHAVLHSPQDKIIWDVGHQCYSHKLLTGRLNQFSTLRQYQGLSGFPKRSESCHDIFDTGHASTSISAALGIARARDIKHQDFSVIAVIGDGSLSGGLALEALNNARNVRRFVVILNDNDMSISAPVGALADYITALRQNPSFVAFKTKVDQLLYRIPKIGNSLAHSIEKLYARSKHLLINYEKAGVIFEELGFRYYGPIDGHNLTSLMSSIRFASSIDKPVLLHVITKKGKGYQHSENEPTRFHGLGSFDLVSGKTKKMHKTELTYSDVLGETLVKLAAENQTIVAITAAMRPATGLDKFAEKFPERFFDVGIAEEHAVTFAAGLATQGLTPIVTIYSSFLQRSYDQLIHDVALQNLPVIFALDRSGLVGEDGPTHHGVFDLSYLRSIPGMTIMAPRDEAELRVMLEFAVAFKKGPIALRYPRGSGAGKAHVAIPMLNYGLSEIFFANEKDPKENKKIKLLIIGAGPTVYEAKLALEKMNPQVNAMIINARFIKPLDSKLINYIQCAEHIVTIEDGTLCGGLYSAVLELMASSAVMRPVHGVGYPDHFIEQGDVKILYQKYQLTAAELIKTFQMLLY